jgi:hypothetical protein
MRLRDELLRAAVTAALDVRPQAGEPDHDGRYAAAVDEIVRVHRVAPIVELRRELDAAGAAITAADVLAGALLADLVDELVATRRAVCLLNGRVAALEVESLAGARVGHAEVARAA